MTGSSVGGDRPLPLDGVTVLDLGQIYQGPYAGFMLAMAGARVIKVEQRRGEPLRARGPSLPYAMLNSSKETVTVDLKRPEGVTLVHRLAAKADVVLVNYAPGVPERLGIGYEDLLEANQRLIYAHATGFGLEGADSAIPAMDVTVQAHVGVMSVTGFPDQGPVKAGIAFIDLLGGTHLYGAITTALFERERTGRGRSVEVAMADATYMTLCSNLGSWFQTGDAPRTGNKHAALGVAPYDVYRCVDGHVALIAVSNRHWRSILEVIGRTDLIGEERLKHNSDRVANMAEVDGLVEAWTQTRPRDEVVAALQASHVPVAAVRVVDEVVRDERQHQRRALQWVDHPELGRVPLPHSPIRWHGSELRPLEPSRPIGADNEAVYGELLGLSADEVASLVSREII
ncbi:MAG: CoA transferase [Actinomycetia bacterium]|nr:CoA transferase [Actinomycetes bacterium]MCP5032079.1 CoA transferase [Actinomycetes bacterium]